MERLENLSDKDMKIFEDENALFKLITILTAINTYGDSPHNKRDSVMQIILKLCMRMIRAPNITTKNAGRKYIQKMIENKKENLDLTWSSLDILAKKLMEFNIIDTIFGATAHEEIIKKSAQIMLFLISSKALSQQNIEDIWSCCLNKHETLAISFFEVLQILLNYIPDNVFF